MRSDTEKINQQKVNQIIDYISVNLHKPLQLDIMAHQIYVSQRQLLRIIGKYGEDELYKIAWNKLICFLKNIRALSEETCFIGISFDDPNVTKSEQCIKLEIDCHMRFYQPEIYQQQSIF